jgi:hypothetical protein
MYRAEWLEVAREALTGVPDATLRTSKGAYRWAITEQGGSIKVSQPAAAKEGTQGGICWSCHCARGCCTAAHYRWS